MAMRTMRTGVLAVVLAIVAMVGPNSSVAPTYFTLVKFEHTAASTPIRTSSGSSRSAPTRDGAGPAAQPRRHPPAGRDGHPHRRRDLHRHPS